MQGAQRAWLPGGRLHLHHGPIDLVIGATGPGVRNAHEAAAARFAGVLQELVDELPVLRRPLGPAWPNGPVAQAMAAAVAPYDVFVTPMAAVAGAVADEICAVMARCGGLDKVYVNNGGDVAFWLSPGSEMVAALAGLPGGRAVITSASPARGIATSGWRGRSHSLGIADSVTVLARNAATADAAATLIANAVDLPRHPAVRKTPARELSPDSDLGDRPVTVDVGPLTGPDIDEALNRGAAFADTCWRRGLIEGVSLTLCGTTRIIGTAGRLGRPKRETCHA